MVHFICLSVFCLYSDFQRLLPAFSWLSIQTRAFTWHSNLSPVRKSRSTVECGHSDVSVAPQVSQQQWWNMEQVLDLAGIKKKKKKISRYNGGAFNHALVQDCQADLERKSLNVRVALSIVVCECCGVCICRAVYMSVGSKVMNVSASPLHSVLFPNSDPTPFDLKTVNTSLCDRTQTPNLHHSSHHTPQLPTPWNLGGM